MFITKKNRLLVYSFLFKEGTIVAKKDFYQEKHSDEIPIHNLEVLCIMRSFKSKGLATETFNWRYYYYILTPEGVKYLREYLGLPEEIVPATYKKAAAPAKAEKSIEDDKAKSAGPGADFNPEFEKTKEGYRS